MNPDALCNKTLSSPLQNNQLQTVLKVVKSVITAYTFYFTENSSLKITANRLVFENRNVES